MRNEHENDTDASAFRRGVDVVTRLPLPRPTAQFRRRAWLAFQRAIDPLAPPRPPPRGGTHATDASGDG